MFNGEESVRIKSQLPRNELHPLIEDSLSRLGMVEFLGRGEFRVSARKFSTFATDVDMDGKLSQGRKVGEWTLRISYVVKPSAVCWIIAVIGFFTCLLGPLILLMPFLAKSDVQRAVEVAVREARDDAEDAS